MARVIIKESQSIAIDEGNLVSSSSCMGKMELVLHVALCPPIVEASVCGAVVLPFFCCASSGGTYTTPGGPPHSDGGSRRTAAGSVVPIPGLMDMGMSQRG